MLKVVAKLLFFICERRKSGFRSFVKSDVRGIDVFFHVLEILVGLVDGIIAAVNVGVGVIGIVFVTFFFGDAVIDVDKS